jgi:hypothetical protein
MMFSAALVQIAAARAILKVYSRTQIARKPLATNALLSPSGAWHILCFSPTSRIRPRKKFFGSPNPSNCWGILHPDFAKRL